MPERLRQSRHSRAAPRPRVRAALLCALAWSCTACPAVLELDPDRESEQEPADAATETEVDPSTTDAVPARVNMTSPRGEAGAPRREVDAGTPCREPSAPPVLHDAAAPTADLAGGRATAPVSPSAGTELALRAVLAAGYLLPCGAEHTHVLQVKDGYELSALGHTGLCAPFETMFYRLLVSKSGEITVLDGVTVNPALLHCDGGVPTFSAGVSEPPLA